MALAAGDEAFKSHFLYVLQKKNVNNYVTELQR
jgi:hypothetical protein